MNKVWFLDSVVSEEWAWAKVFTPEECAEIVRIGNTYPNELGEVGDGVVENLIRTSNIAWMNTDVKVHRWIYERVTQAINSLNKQFYNYDITHIEAFQFTKYDKTGSFYGKHTDVSYVSAQRRKLSFSIQLCDSDSYSGGDLLFHTSANPTSAKRDIGVMTVFPSYTLHEVTPIKSGIRYSLVGWCNGPQLK